jgi:hypothetical protein
MRRKTQTSAKPRNHGQKGPPIGSAAHDGAAELSPAQQLGSLGGAARARNLTAEQRREIAQKAAAKRWARFARPQATPTNSSDRGLRSSTAGEHGDTTALIERNHHLLSRAAEVRLRSEEVAAQSEVVVGRAIDSNGTVAAPCSRRVAWRNRR